MRNWRILAFVLAVGVGGAYAIITFFSPDENLRPGSLGEGPVEAGRPCEGIPINDGDDLAVVANAAPPGTTFCITGFHRLSGEIVPKDGQRFIGVDRPVLNGSHLLASFAREGSFWVATDQTQDYSNANDKIGDEPCMDGFEGCRYPEDVYVDDGFLMQVLSLSDLESGQYFFDYAADKIYLADDPAGRKVEASVVRRAFANYERADNVVVRGLVIEKFSSYAGQDAALGAFHGSAWLIEDNEIRLNHGSGITVGGTEGLIIRRNYIHHNGCGGINGPDSRALVIERNEIAFNNALHYLPLWSCGGGKLVRGDGVSFKQNYSHDNNGFGFWTDGNNINIVYERNVFEDNAMGGVMHEINDGTEGPTAIRDNVLRRNGFGHPNRVMMGAAIIISASSYVEIVGNIIQGNAHGITLNYTLREELADRDVTVHDIVVRDNVFGLRYGSNPFGDVGRVGFFTSTVGSPMPQRITFADNHYFLGDPRDGQHFSLADRTVPYTLTTVDDWQAAGFDTSSTFESLSKLPSDL